MLVLRDVCGLIAKGAEEVNRWSAFALLRAGLDGSPDASAPSMTKMRPTLGATRFEEINMEGLHVPGVPEDAIIEELPPMRVEDVRGCVESIARAASQDPVDLLDFATETASREAQSAKAKAERVEGEVDVMRRERLLPNDKTLEKISRYEAHLSRQLYHALHELENLQKYRTTGEGVPLARLNVQGLSPG